MDSWFRTSRVRGFPICHWPACESVWNYCAATIVGLFFQSHGMIAYKGYERRIVSMLVLMAGLWYFVPEAPRRVE